MATELVPKLWDDLDLSEKGVKTPADGCVRFGLDGQWYSIDLTAGHMSEGMALLKRWARASQQIDPPQPRRTGGMKGLKQDPASVAYKASLREFVKAHPELSLSFLTSTGKHYYPEKLHKAYLSEQLAMGRELPPEHVLPLGVARWLRREQERAQAPALAYSASGPEEDQTVRVANLNAGKGQRGDVW